MIGEPVSPLLECPVCPAVWGAIDPDPASFYTVPWHFRLQINAPKVICLGSNQKLKLTYYDSSTSL